MSGLPVPPEGGSPLGESSGQTRGPDQRLGREQRLIRSANFQEAFSQNHKWVGRYMVLWLRSGTDACLRLGVVTSRKVGGAVQRVRARRLLREVFRINRHLLHGPYDVVLVARGHVLNAGTAAIRKEFLDLANKAGVYTPQ